jgi:hypothetical protein
MRQQVPILGIVMIILGILNVLFYSAYAVLTALGITLDTMDNMQYMDDAEAIGQVVGSGVGIAWIGVWVLGGIFWILAGILIRRFKGRGFAIAMLIAGIIPCCFAHLCCTWVINLGVGIWGLIVLFNADTAVAFQEVAEGALPEEVLDDEGFGI